MYLVYILQMPKQHAHGQVQTPCTSHLHPKVQLACKTKSITVDFSWSAEMILLLRHTFLIATKVVHQTDKLLA